MIPLTQVRIGFQLTQPVLLFMFKFAMSCHVDNCDSTNIVSFGLIQLWKCVPNWFIVQPIHKCLLDICHLYILGAAYPKRDFILFGQSLCVNDSQLIENLQVVKHSIS